MQRCNSEALKGGKKRKKEKRKTGKKKTPLMYTGTLSYRNNERAYWFQEIFFFFCDQKSPAGFSSLMWLLLVDHMKEV